MKSYTDIEQSKKLADILPLESADMWWVALNWQETEYYVEVKQDGINQPKKAVPCWSLAALLEIIPKNVEGLNRLRIDIDNVDFSIWYDDLKGYGVNDKLPDITLKEPADACVEMIIKLYKKGLL